MRHFIAKSLCAVLFAGLATASVYASTLSSHVQAQQQVDEAVMGPYRLYVQAYDAGNYAQARTHAQAAYEQAIEYNIDVNLRAILTENLAALEFSLGHFDRAEPLYLEARDIYLEVDPNSIRAWTLQTQAGRAAFEREDINRARRLVDEVGDHLETLEMSQDVKMALFDARAQQALFIWMEGKGLQAGWRAQEALRVLGRGHEVVNIDAALMHYMAGIRAYFEEDYRDAAYDFSLTYSLFSHLDPEDEVAEIAYAWAAHSRSKLSDGHRLRLLGELQDSPIYTQFYQDEDEGDPEPTYVDAYPLERAAPRYPHRAEQAGLEGVALFKFDIDPAGRVHNVRIVASVPHPIFGEAAQDVVETWRYEPRRQDGEAIEAKDIVSSFEFRLAN